MFFWPNSMFFRQIWRFSKKYFFAKNRCFFGQIRSFFCETEYLSWRTFVWNLSVLWTTEEVTPQCWNIFLPNFVKFDGFSSNFKIFKKKIFFAKFNVFSSNLKIFKKIYFLPKMDVLLSNSMFFRQILRFSKKNIFCQK